TNSGCVGCHWLLAENMFIGFDGGFEMNWTKSGWRRQNDAIDAAFEHFLVSVQSDKATVVLDFHALADFGIGLESIAARFQPICERVAHRGDDDVLVGGQRLFGRA